MTLRQGQRLVDPSHCADLLVSWARFPLPWTDLRRRDLEQTDTHPAGPPSRAVWRVHGRLSAWERDTLLAGGQGPRVVVHFGSPVRRSETLARAQLE
jgi:hypothetical protein